MINLMTETIPLKDAINCVRIEPELDDEMPDYVYDRMCESKQFANEICRAAVATTKKNIEERIIRCWHFDHRSDKEASE